MSFTVRAAESGEEARVVPLYEWLFAPPGSLPASWEERRATVALRQAIDSHDCVVLVAEDESGDLVGFCTGYQDMHSVRFGYRVWVEDLAVAPSRRSTGIGKARRLRAFDRCNSSITSPDGLRLDRDHRALSPKRAVAVTTASGT